MADVQGARVEFRALVVFVVSVLVVAVLAVGCSSSTDDNRASTTKPPPDVDLVLATSGRLVATVDPRYQSYNIEMVEVTGGQFWQPYDAGSGKVTRPPIDLGSQRLRNLARALGPAYIRVSGSWANSTYFDADGTSGDVAPEGFGGVLTRDQWLGVRDFANAVGGEIVTSFASSDGVRDPSGVWQPTQARALLQFSRDNGVPLVAAEFFNEPSLPIGMPAGYDAAAYERDFAKFVAMVGQAMPDLRLVGPGATGDVLPLVVEPSITATDLLAASGSALDVFSYHFYPKVSARCGSTEGPELALSDEFLSRLDATKSYYEGLRDAHLPGAPIWVTETAEAACGGDRWAEQYRDVFRYVETLGKLADGDGAVVFHNTLAASDYGLLDENGLEPRPDYWAAVLWHALMGPKVLTVDAGTPTAGLAVYAHCTPEADRPSVTYAIANSSQTESRTLTTPSGEAQVYLLSAPGLDSTTVSLNGKNLVAAADGTIPALEGEATHAPITVPPASIAFVVTPTDVPACS